MPKTTRRGRPPHRNRVSLQDDIGARCVRLSLSSDLAQYLGAVVPGKMRVAIGDNKLRISAAGEGQAYSIFRNGRAVYCNLRLPDLVFPKRVMTMTIPHELRADAIIADLSPLRQTPT